MKLWVAQLHTQKFQALQIINLKPNRNASTISKALSASWGIIKKTQALIALQEFHRKKNLMNYMALSRQILQSLIICWILLNVLQMLRHSNNLKKIMAKQFYAAMQGLKVGLLA